MISLCMIVKNEEDYLDKCLNSAKDIADEIIIVDTGSTDSTVEIAKKYTNKIFYFEWINDFSAARNFSISKASGDWILILDGDDELSSKNKSKIRELTNDKNVDVYFFNTLNIMEQNNKDNILINQNPRLFQNKPGYKYEGEVHNQLVSVIQKVNPKAVIDYAPIDIYHYGYLNSTVQKKDKRKRNMTLIQKQLDHNPTDPFALYNMGNEYYSLNNVKKAFDYYLTSYKYISVNVAFYPRLIMRMLVCCLALNLYNDANKYSREVLKYYPDFTDIYYIMGLINRKAERPTAAVRNLEKAIELGESPQSLLFFKGAGSYKSLEILYHIYLDFEDYEKCLDCSMKLIKYPEKININLLKTIIHCMYKLNISLENALNYILALDIEKGYIYASNVLIIEKDFNLALKYTNKGLTYLQSLNLNKTVKDSLINTLQYYKGICQFNLKNYKNSIETLMNLDGEDVLYYNLPHILLAGIIIEDEIAVNFSTCNTSPAGKVSRALFDILNNKSPEILSQNVHESSEYEEIILSIFNMLLNIEEEDKLKKSLSLLDLILCEDSNLKLGKLYYEYGKYKLCKKELLRSIYNKNIIDKKSARILSILL